MSVHVEFVQTTDETIVTYPPIVLVTDQQEVYQDTDLEDQLKNCAQLLGDRIVAYEGNGSGWVIDKLIWLDTTVWKITPLRGESYHPLPDWIQNTKCVVIVQNTDQECFRHSIMASLYDVTDNKHRVNSYTQFYAAEDAPDFSNLDFPLKIDDIRRFESRNPSISVNVYGVADYSDPLTAPIAEVDAEDGDGGIDEMEDEETEGEPVGESTMSDGEGTDSDDEDEETEEDRQFLDDADYDDGDISFYRNVDNVLEQQTVEDEANAPQAQQAKRWGNRKGYIYPLRIAPEIKARHVNLLCTEDPDDEGRFHYSTIRNFGGLMRSQYNKHGGHRLHFCYR